VQVSQDQREGVEVPHQTPQSNTARAKRRTITPHVCPDRPDSGGHSAEQHREHEDDTSGYSEAVHMLAPRIVASISARARSRNTTARRYKEAVGASRSCEHQCSMSDSDRLPVDSRLDAGSRDTRVNPVVYSPRRCRIYKHQTIHSNLCLLGCRLASAADNTACR